MVNLARRGPPVLPRWKVIDPPLDCDLRKGRNVGIEPLFSTPLFAEQSNLGKKNLERKHFTGAEVAVDDGY